MLRVLSIGGGHLAPTYPIHALDAAMDLTTWVVNIASMRWYLCGFGARVVTALSYSSSLRPALDLNPASDGGYHRKGDSRVTRRQYVARLPKADEARNDTFS